MTAVRMLALAGATVLFAACGGGGEDSASAGEAGAAPETAAAPVGAEQTALIQLWSEGTPAFGSPFPSLNPAVDQTVSAGSLYPFRMSFTP